MPTANHTIGDSFPVQFAWKLPNGDYLRAVFKANVLDTVPAADKYIVRLSKLVAGRQESGEGEIRPTSEYDREYWEMVWRIVGNKMTIAYEADDGRAIQLRLATLTGEHNYFYRFTDAEELIRRSATSAEDPSP